MGKPAARVGDMHTCPMVTGFVSHNGGPILPPGKPTVIIGGMPAATMGSMCTCTGPTDSIILGSTGVMIGGQPAARMGDKCAHGGAIVAGCPTVLIGEAAGVAPSNKATAINFTAIKVKALQDSLTSKSSGVLFSKSPTLNLELFGSGKKGDNKKNDSSGSEKFQKESVKRDSIKGRIEDGNGIPMVNILYSLKLPNGRIIIGKSDENGQFEIGNLEPGSCGLTFPELDSNDFKIT